MELKNYIFIVFILPIIVSCVHNSYQINPYEGFWNIANYRSNIDKNNFAKFMSLRVSDYSLSPKSERDMEIYQTSKDLPIKEFTIVGLEKGKGVPQSISILFSPNYCIKAKTLESYSWTSQGYAKNVPIHVLQMPRSADTFRWGEVGHKFVRKLLLSKSITQETSVKFLKECDTKVYIERAITEVHIEKISES